MTKFLYTNSVQHPLMILGRKASPWHGHTCVKYRHGHFLPPSDGRSLSRITIPRDRYASLLPVWSLSLKSWPSTQIAVVETYARVVIDLNSYHIYMFTFFIFCLVHTCICYTLCWQLPHVDSGQLNLPNVDRISTLGRSFAPCLTLSTWGKNDAQCWNSV